ncbi:MAG TPA: PDZ domain-containing protein [Thermoanaerobaculia bacterium]|nr:PDZ domain-containing protein [Thermoanaerobaculia bacterium]
MVTFRSLRWTLAGATVLLLAHSPCDAEEKKARRIETKVIVVDGEDATGHERLLRLALGRDLDCTEENGRKICFAKAGFGHAFAGTFLGVHLTESTPELREHLGGPREAGVLVSRIEEESPAADAGIRVGDIVTAVDGEPVESARDLRRSIASREAGDAVAIELYRDGRLEQVSATLARREPRDLMKRWQLAAPMLHGEELSKRIREALEGIDLEDLDAQVRSQLDAVDWEAIRESVRTALDRALERSEK